MGLLVGIKARCDNSLVYRENDNHIEERIVKLGATSE